MKIKDIVEIDGTKCELGVNDGKIYLLSNFANLQGVLKNYKWEDVGCYGQCLFNIENSQQLSLVINIINDVCNTRFLLEFVEIKPTTLRHKDDKIQDVIFKNANKEIYKIRLVLNKNGEYNDEDMKNRERDFIVKISSIIYWICMENTL